MVTGCFIEDAGVRRPGRESVQWTTWEMMLTWAIVVAVVVVRNGQIWLYIEGLANGLNKGNNRKWGVQNDCLTLRSCENGKDNVGVRENTWERHQSWYDWGCTLETLTLLIPLTDTEDPGGEGVDFRYKMLTFIWNRIFHFQNKCCSFSDFQNMLSFQKIESISVSYF